MPIKLSTEDILKIMKDDVFHYFIIAIVIAVASFVTGRVTAPECRQDVICADIIRDRDELSNQLQKQYAQCQHEKINELKSLKEELDIVCADRVDRALEGCEFSEDIHCSICIARGVCKP